MSTTCDRRVPDLTGKSRSPYEPSSAVAKPDGGTALSLLLLIIRSVTASPACFSALLDQSIQQSPKYRLDTSAGRCPREVNRSLPCGRRGSSAGAYRNGSGRCRWGETGNVRADTAFPWSHDTDTDAEAVAHPDSSRSVSTAFPEGRCSGHPASFRSARLLPSSPYDPRRDRSAGHARDAGQNTRCAW